MIKKTIQNGFLRGQGQQNLQLVIICKITSIIIDAFAKKL